MFAELQPQLFGIRADLALSEAKLFRAAKRVAARHPSRAIPRLGSAHCLAPLAKEIEKTAVAMEAFWPRVENVLEVCGESDVVAFEALVSEAESFVTNSCRLLDMFVGADLVRKSTKPYQQFESAIKRYKSMVERASKSLELFRSYRAIQNAKAPDELRASETLLAGALGIKVVAEGPAK